MKRRAAMYMLIRFVDENDGSITINTNEVKRVFSSKDDIVRIEYVNGKVDLLANAAFKTMDDAILKWKKRRSLSKD